MNAVPLPHDEAARLAALHEYHILDTPPDDVYDGITRLAAVLCNTPIAILTFLDADRLWFKSAIGLSFGQIPRDVSFCAQAVLQRGDMMVVPDARHDRRFADNPFVTGEPHARFYVGAPLVTAGGYTLGFLCVLDRVPRQITPEQETALRTLARQTMNTLQPARVQEKSLLQAESFPLVQREFVRDVMASVTNGRLILCDTAADLPAPLAPVGEAVAFSRAGGSRKLRDLASGAAVGEEKDRLHDLVTAVAEASMNAIVHGGGVGSGQVSVGFDGTVQVRVEDEGPGIGMEDLPLATLALGYSTKGSLGYGFKLMRQVDRVYVLTGPSGTTVVLEQGRTAPLQPL